MNQSYWNKINSLPAKPGVFVLILLMAATRFQHFGNSISLPDASIAVFFLAGLWFGGIRLFTFLLFEAGLIDYIAITQFGVSDFCISPAYVFLIPTYAVVWFGGRYSANLTTKKQSHLILLFLLLLVSVSLAFIISNGSFFLLSDKYPESSWTEYLSRFIQYYPPYIQYSVFYVVLIYGLNQLIKLMALQSSETE